MDRSFSFSVLVSLWLCFGMQLGQERLQQQLSSAKAACKASEHSKAQTEAQYQAEVADLMQQLQAATQYSSDLAEQHQQMLSEQVAAATAATAVEHQQEVADLRQHYTHCLRQHTTAVAELHAELATATTQAKDDMTHVSQHMQDVQSDSCHHQAELWQQLQQLGAEVAALRQDGVMGCSSQGISQQIEVKQALQQLADMQQQLAEQGCTGLAGLLQLYEKAKAQVSASRHQLQC